MKFVTSMVSVVLVLGLAACAGELERPTRGVAPLLGSADGTDAADRACNVVLRDLARVPGEGGGYENVCAGGACWYVWEGTLDVSDAAVSEGAVPEVTYQSGSDQTWWVSGTTPISGAASGYQRYAVRLFEHTVSPGMSFSALMRTRIQVAPYLRTRNGGRLFDHNRNPGDFDNYLLVVDNAWRIDADPSVCGGAPVPVKLASAQVFTQFDYPAITHTTLKGVVRASAGGVDDAGESVTVHYRISEGANVVRDWTTVDASLVSAGVWEFETPVFDSACPHYCARHVYQFAIAHTAAGETEWDNNGGPGVDYVLADDVGGSVPVYYGPPGILDTPVQLSYVTWQGGTVSGVARGEILLENLAYRKDVRLVYSTDGWVTRQERKADFRRTSYENLEYWQFVLPFGEAPADLQLLVRYEVAGDTYLDTNFGRYYRMSVAP